MSRWWIAFAVAVLLLGVLTRRSCVERELEPAGPGAKAAESRSSGPTELLPPDPTARGRVAAAVPEAAVEEPEAAQAAELPLLLSGQVIDGGGIGVPSATVQLERHITDSSGFGMRSIGVQPLPRLTTRTSAEGRFEVRGEAQGALVVRAVKQGYVLREEVTCELPTRGVTLVLERGGAILVTVAPAVNELADMLYVEIRPPGGDRDVHGAVSSFREGRALREALLPGPYDVALVGRLGRHAVHTVPGVLVVAGETTEDLRLNDLALHAWMHAIRVTVVDPSERPMPGVAVWVHHGFGEIGLQTEDDGSLELVAGQDGIDIALRESGWRNVGRKAVTEDVVIHLERPLELRLVRPQGRSAALGDLYLYVGRVQAEGDSSPTAGGSDWTLPAEENAVVVALDGAGTYRVQWAAVFPFAGRGTANFYPRDVTFQEIEVAEDAGPQEVVLELDPAAVDELLARITALASELERWPGETEAEHERRVMQAVLRENRH